MRVRHRIDGGDAVLVCPDTTDICGVKYYWRVDEDSRLCLYPAAFYEPVPTTRWVDVTAECDIKHSSIQFNGVDVHTAQWHCLGSFRLRKSRVCDSANDGMEWKYVFTVEKKESV